MNRFLKEIRIFYILSTLVILFVHNTLNAQFQLINQQTKLEIDFHLTQPANRVIIKVYTIAGRLLRTLEGNNFEAGFHRIEWNGLDQDRDMMANRVYLYKIVARSGDKQIEKIKKLIIMRFLRNPIDKEYKL